MRARATLGGEMKLESIVGPVAASPGMLSMMRMKAQKEIKLPKRTIGHRPMRFVQEPNTPKRAPPAMEPTPTNIPWRPLSEKILLFRTGEILLS